MNRDLIELEVNELAGSRIFKSHLSEIAQGIAVGIMMELSKLIECYNGDSSLEFNYGTLYEIQNIKLLKKAESFIR